MAPEVIELKGPSTASDIWSLGCTIIELLTGHPPYSDTPNGMSVMFKIVEDDHPPFPEGCSEDLLDFLGKCFIRNPEDRPTAEALFEHPWLKQNFESARVWQINPFVDRILADRFSCFRCFASLTTFLSSDGLAWT